ncbi:MAG: hypothetical protein WC451_06075 [Patescibacteria group bacterium]
MDATTVAVIFGALYAVSEALSLIPAIKANGTIQLFFNLIKIIAGKK